MLGLLLAILASHQVSHSGKNKGCKNPQQASADVVDFLSLGALPDDLSDRAAWHNGVLLNKTLKELRPGTQVTLSQTVTSARRHAPLPKHDLPGDGRHRGQAPAVCSFPGL